MALSIYETTTLIRVVENLKEPSQFLLDMFFPNVTQSDTEMVSIDVFDGKRRLAPFVNPLVEGKFVEGLGFTTPTFAPPYLKPKTRLDPKRAVRRTRGERIGGAMTPIERAAANLRLEMEDQMNQIFRRMEWMGAKAMTDGAITVVGDGVPTAVINFGRDASLNITLSGGNRWGQAGVSPSNNIDDWSALVLKRSGYPVTDVVFTPAAWRLFRADPLVAAVVQSFRNGNEDFSAAGVRPERGGIRLGSWGQYTLWIYYEWFIDPADGVEKPLLTDGTVILGSKMVQGERAFAAIQDEDVGFPSIPFCPKSWTEKDPGVRWLMTQSAPLTIPSNVNASASAQVI
ncbi:major capsid protein [Roseomonas frigidaquae]|uniref:Major capsid protein n=1 Tax=Falsiroseomonas frigidaquae TaxID=487318 RepID=A0ABX1ESR4_9PROT|nr:major capsid protein [Falsiroseomonas frigidaquae]NKE43573.1 major capsid protein [Falsiroseomonas frigidaquae]